ncbi:HNH endonuclease signature motif containing protein [Streptomyces collinus]|uniref:HNH endonuclease signature motif containing protein n=1 Tax=Streptomyces collinus TaxID=42684 RepID=UPI00378C301D
MIGSPGLISTLAAPVARSSRPISRRTRSEEAVTPSRAQNTRHLATPRPLRSASTRRFNREFVACDTLLEREAAGRHEVRRGTTTERRDRDDAARRAVLRRSEGRCENPECLLPDLPYRTMTGEPLLEVDHIDNHAAGGRDYPSAMIALCPNCHVNKTRGADQDELRERLRAVTLGRHQALRAKGRD